MTHSLRAIAPLAVERLLTTVDTLHRSLFTPIIRTDFSDDGAWETAWRDITTQRLLESDDVVLNANLIVIPEFDGWTGEELAELLTRTNQEGFLLVVDAVTLASREHPVLVVKMDSEPDDSRAFRAIPSTLLDLEVMFLLSNRGWEDLSHSVDSDGVLRTISTSEDFRP